MSSKVKCLVCGEILESKYRHDFQMCKCKNETFVDGGDDYTRVGGMELKKIKVLKAVKMKKKKGKKKNG